MGGFDNAKMVKINNKEVASIKTNSGGIIYQKPTSIVVTGNSITLGQNTSKWLTGNAIIYWGDGTSSVYNQSSISHTYTDGESNHTIIFVGAVTQLKGAFSGSNIVSIVVPDGVTSLGASCFDGCTRLTSVTIPDSVTSLGNYCFRDCSGLTSITIPDSVTSIGDYCFYNCSSLIDYQLYWTGNNIITYDSKKMPNNTNTIFTVPEGEIQNYINKGYPMLKLQERIITNDGIIYRKPMTATFTGDDIQLGMDREYWFMPAVNIVINWGDGTSDTVIPRTSSYHIYTDGKSEHTIILIGGITSIEYGFVDESDTNLTSITIPDNIESLGDYCFGNCTNLIDYQLYWTGNNIITYDSKKMINNTNTVFTIPNGETANYIAKGYPSDKLVERS